MAIWLRKIEYNIEFSCPAASTYRFLELLGCIHRFTQHLRGQLQRQVMTTICVMAWHQRSKLSAHATEQTPLQKSFSTKSASCPAAFLRMRVPQPTGNNLRSRASNSGVLLPRHHLSAPTAVSFSSNLDLNRVSSLHGVAAQIN